MVAIDAFRTGDIRGEYPCGLQSLDSDRLCDDRLPSAEVSEF